MSSTRFDANRATVTGLLAMLHDPDVEIADLQHEIALDVGLSFRLLRYINSAFGSLHHRVSSIGQAVSLLGLSRLEQWASLTVFTSTDAKPAKLTVTALVRARFCELAAQDHPAANGSEMFTLGLFSVIDTRFETPMGELLSTLPLAPEMCAALLPHTGRTGEMLECLDALEDDDFNKAVGILPSARELYTSALRWADEITGAAAREKAGQRDPRAPPARGPDQNDVWQELLLSGAIRSPALLRPYDRVGEREPASALTVLDELGGDA